MTLVRDVMTPAPQTVSADTLVTEVAGRMRDEDIGSLIVIEHGKVRGMITDRDLVVRVIADGGRVSEVLIEDACSDPAVTVAPDDDVDHAAGLMRSRAVRRLPVVEEGRPVGVVSLGDLAVAGDPASTLARISSAAPNR